MVAACGGNRARFRGGRLSLDALASRLGASAGLIQQPTHRAPSRVVFVTLHALDLEGVWIDAGWEDDERLVAASPRRRAQDELPAVVGGACVASRFELGFVHLRAIGAGEATLDGRVCPCTAAGGP